MCQPEEEVSAAEEQLTSNKVDAITIILRAEQSVLFVFIG
jgi:hypothetical protein